MDALDEMMTAFEAIGRELDAPDMKPDPARDDWGPVQVRLDGLLRRLEAEVLSKLEEGAKILAAESPEAATNLRNNVGHMSAELASVFCAAGQRGTADKLFARALRARPVDEPLAELEAAAREPDVFVKLTLGRWHHRAGDFALGDQVLGGSRRAASEPALRRAFQKGLEGPRPLTGGAPGLFRLNGFGMGLYGERDRRPDGSYIATHAISALFLPVLALGAYRVIGHGGGSYTFYAKERLSTFAKGWNVSLLAAVVLGLIGTGISSYLDSPERLASLALEQAEALEASGDSAAAAAAYQDVIDDYGVSTGTAQPAAAGLLRVLTEGVETPMTAPRADEAVRIVRRFEGLPSDARNGAVASILAAALGTWADQIGSDDETSRRAALRLIDMGAELAEGADGEAMRSRAATLHMATADSLRGDWPQEALHHYVQAATPEAMAAVSPIVAQLSASVLADVDADVRSWEATAPEGDELNHVRTLRAQLTEWRDDVRRSRALEAGDAEALDILHEERPEDQEVGAALANARRAAGDIEGATAILEAYGAPGQLSSQGLASLAGALADDGRLEQADALLTRLVNGRLPAFQEAQRAYDTAYDARVEALLSRARAGLEVEINRQLERVQDDDEVRRLVDAWLRQRMDADSSLTELRDAYSAQAGIVPTALTLGTIKLRRANEAAGEERETLLSEAERLFLAIRQQAAGVPAYHLSLGQVYHRLGRAEEGEAELRELLAGGDPAIALNVASVYRSLGLIERAREVATGLYERTSGGEDSAAIRGSAAQLMALMASDLDDNETWLLRAPQDNEDVQTSLLQVRASRALERRELDVAGRLFQEVAERYEAAGESSPSALNNASLAQMSRYRCDGNPAHLERAAEQMAQAMGLVPDEGLVVGNYARLENYRGEIRVLDAHLRTRSLRLSSAETSLLLGWLRQGPRGADVLAALRIDASSRHARELTQLEQTLAPQGIDAWHREWGWTRATQDVEATRALLRRVSMVTNLDQARGADARGRERTEEQEVQHRRQLDAAVTQMEALVAATRRARHAPTTAAALHLLAGSLASRAWQTSSLADAVRSSDVAREGVSTWDGLGDGYLPWALVTRALFEMMPDQPGLRQTYEAHHENLSIVFILEAAARQSPNVIAALQTNALLDEACALRANLPAEWLGLNDILLGELAAHPALQTAASPARTRELSRLNLDISERLDPDDEELVSRRAILDDG